MARDLIYNIKKGKNTLDPALQKSEGLSRKLGKSISGVAKVVGVVGIAFLAAAAATASVIRKVTKDAKEVQNALIGLESVAGATGNSIEGATEAAKALAADGLIPLGNASNSLKNLLGSGLNLEKSIKLLDAFKDAAAFNKQGQLELGDAIEGATEGFKNDQSVKTDNIGITKNISNITKEYAASIGKTVGELDKAERVQAKFSGFMKEGAIFTGDYAKLLNTFSGAQTQAAGSFKFLSASIGGLIINAPGASAVVRSMSEAFQALTKEIEENKGPLTLAVSKIARLFKIKPGGLLKDLIDGKINFRGFKEINRDLIAANKKILELEESGDGWRWPGSAAEDIVKLRARVAVFKEDLKELAEIETKKKVEKTLAAAVDDERIQREKKVAVLLQEIKDEQTEIEAEQIFKDIDEEGLRGEERLGRISEQLAAEKELEDLAVLERAAGKVKSDADLVKIEDARAKAELLAALELEKKKLALKKTFQGQALSLAANTAALLQALGGKENKAAFLITKAAAVAQLALQTASALGAVPFQTSHLLFPANGIAAGQLTGLIYANAAVQGATIAATTLQGMNHGGILEGSSSGDNNVAAAFNGGEMFLTRPEQAELFNISKGNRPDEGGNNSLPPVEIVIELNGRELARSLRELNDDGVKTA